MKAHRGWIWTDLVFLESFLPSGNMTCQKNSARTPHYWKSGQIKKLEKIKKEHFAGLEPDLFRTIKTDFRSILARPFQNNSKRKFSQTFDQSCQSFPKTIETPFVGTRSIFKLHWSQFMLDYKSSMYKRTTTKTLQHMQHNILKTCQCLHFFMLNFLRSFYFWNLWLNVAKPDKKSWTWFVHLNSEEGFCKL